MNTGIIYGTSKDLMKEWQIRLWINETGKSPVEKWLKSLDRDQRNSVAKELTMLELAGNDLRMPHSRALGDGLFELRERRYGFRIYYCFRDNYIIIVLAAGNKKSQQKDIHVSRERLRE